MASSSITIPSSLITGKLQVKQQQRRHGCLPLPPRMIRCAVADQAPARRNANFQSGLWSDRYIQSIASSNEVEEKVRENKIHILKEKTRRIINEDKNLEDQLQLIDHLQQLGIAYHFKDEIKTCLGKIYISLEDVSKQLENNLHATALLFRLLRENGFDISDDIFKGSMSRRFQQEIKGTISLYEASYFAKEGEALLDEARELTTKHLKSLLVNEGSLEPQLRELVTYALELPLNWRMKRLHATWFIELCRKQAIVHPALLELAILDFNEVQSIHKRELIELSRWWENLGLAHKLPFFRDRLAENYLWTVGCALEPEFWSYREMQTKAICLAVALDDMYDVYGSLDELELFTNVVNKWDVNAIDALPEFMKLCFLSIFNLSNDAAYRVLRDKGLDVSPYLKRAWADLCNAFFLEAKWYHQGYAPKLQEYLDNGWITSIGHVSVTHAYCMSAELTREALESFTSYPKITQWSSMILRLHNDLATSADELERGDTCTSLHCIMHEKGVSEAGARERVKGLIMANWRAINGNRACASLLEECFKNVTVNLGRIAQFYYRYGDGYGKADGEMKVQFTSLLLQPIKL